MKKHLLFFSNLYPNPTLPNQATFNYQQVQALAEWFEVSVISPIPWIDKAAVRSAAKVTEWGSISVDYQTYWYTPGICRSFYGQMMLASVMSRAKKLHQAKPFDVMLGSWLYPDGWVASQLAQSWQVPCYLKVHGTDVNRLKSGGHLTKLSLQAVNNSRGVICVSQALKKRLVELGASKDKCHVIYNGVNSEVFRPRPKIESRLRLGLPEQGKIILYVGNLIETKGLGELATAFSSLAKHRSDARLVVIGSGGWEGTFREKIRQEGIAERVDLFGSINHTSIGLFMNASDVLCLPSYMEGIPNVILEALASNLKVVATSVGGVPELASADDRITLAVPKSPACLQEALEFALQQQQVGEKRITIQSWRENTSMLASIIREIN